MKAVVKEKTIFNENTENKIVFSKGKEYEVTKYHDNFYHVKGSKGTYLALPKSTFNKYFNLVE